MTAETAEYVSLTTRKVVDNISEYIKKQLKTIPVGIQVYVGTDSQDHDTRTVYVTAIVLHYGNTGGHVIYSREDVPRIRDRFSRLYGEVERSVQVARFLRDDCGIPVSYIDLDLNSSKKWDSNKVLPSATGLCEAFRFQHRCKPGAAYAVRIADILCRHA